MPHPQSAITNPQPSQRTNDGLIEVAGLWERTSANGREYIGGRTPDEEDITIPAGSFVMVFPNESDNPRAPAFRLLYSPPRDDQPQQAPRRSGAFDRFKGEPATPQAQATGEPAKGNPMTHVPPADDITDSDIPF